MLEVVHKATKAVGCGQRVAWKWDSKSMIFLGGVAVSGYRFRRPRGPRLLKEETEAISRCRILLANNTSSQKYNLRRGHWKEYSTGSSMLIRGYRSSDRLQRSRNNDH